MLPLCPRPARDDGRAREPAHMVKRFASAERLMGARCKNKKWKRSRHDAELLLRAAVNHGAISRRLSAAKTWPLKIFPLPQHCLFSASAHNALSTLSSELSRHRPPPSQQNHRCLQSLPTAPTADDIISNTHSDDGIRLTGSGRVCWRKFHPGKRRLPL